MSAEGEQVPEEALGPPDDGRPRRQLPNGRGWLRLLPPYIDPELKRLALALGKRIAEDWMYAQTRDDYLGGW